MNNLDIRNKQELRRILLQVAQGIKAEAVKNIIQNGTSDTGLLAQSIEVIEQPDGSIQVGSPLVYAPCIEFGTLPHQPPVEPIEGWVKRKLGVPDDEAHSVAWAVAMKIKKEGTPPQPYMRPAIEKANRILHNILGR